MNKSAKCCTRKHLTLEEWGLLEDCTRLTCGGLRPFFLDGRTAAMRFERTGKDAIYRIINSLESRGWLVRVGGGTRNKIGRYDPTSYRVVTHEDWIKVEGHACLELSTGTSLENETGSNPSTSLDSTPTSLDSTNHLSRFGLPPVEKSRHSSEKALEKASVVASVENQPQEQERSPFSNSQGQPQPQEQPPVENLQLRGKYEEFLKNLYGATAIEEFRSLLARSINPLDYSAAYIETKLHINSRISGITGGTGFSSLRAREHDDNQAEGEIESGQ